MRYRLFIILLLAVIVLPVTGQSNRKGSEGDLLTRLLTRQEEGSFNLEIDSLLVSNYYKLITVNEKKSGVPGYRIRIFSDSGLGAKEEQQKVRARFISLFPGIDAHYHYDEPFFKVYVGDCRTRSEALKLLDRVKVYFPNAIYVPDLIEVE
jgi:hypothetical protein